MSRITAPVGEVTTPMVRGRNGSGRLLAASNSPSAALVEQRHQCALAGQLHPLDHQLIFRSAGVGGELAGGDDLGPVLGPECQAGRAATPQHPVDAGVGVLQRQVAMARGMALPPRNLAAHADMAERALDRALERARNLADRERGRVVACAALG